MRCCNGHEHEQDHDHRRARRPGGPRRPEQRSIRTRGNRRGNRRIRDRVRDRPRRGGETAPARHRLGERDGRCRHVPARDARRQPERRRRRRHHGAVHRRRDDDARRGVRAFRPRRRDVISGAASAEVGAAFPFNLETRIGGGDGNDRLTGGDSADTLTGGPGDDSEDGGQGFDVFIEEAAANGDDDFFGGGGPYDKLDTPAHAGVAVDLDGSTDDGQPRRRATTPTPTSDRWWGLRRRHDHGQLGRLHPPHVVRRGRRRHRDRRGRPATSSRPGRERHAARRSARRLSLRREGNDQEFGDAGLDNFGRTRTWAPVRHRSERRRRAPRRNRGRLTNRKQPT